MPPFNNHRQSDPQLRRRAVFYFLAGQEFGGFAWFTAAEDLASAWRAWIKDNKLITSTAL